MPASLLLTLVMSACGGGGGGGTVHDPGTPKGTYTPIVTGATDVGSSAMSHNVDLTRTVS
jgi:hypothetical protein